MTVDRIKIDAHQAIRTFLVTRAQTRPGSFSSLEEIHQAAKGHSLGTVSIVLAELDADSQIEKRTGPSAGWRYVHRHSASE